MTDRRRFFAGRQWSLRRVQLKAWADCSGVDARVASALSVTNRTRLIPRAAGATEALPSLLMQINSGVIYLACRHHGGRSSNGDRRSGRKLDQLAVGLLSGKWRNAGDIPFVRCTAF